MTRPTHSIGAVALLALLTACSSPPSASADAARVELAAEYQARWWSSAQMEGLDPDAPPSKDATVVLERWEYSDPVAVPHPDRVDLVVTVAHMGQEPLDLVLRAASRWREGPLEDGSQATWSASEPLDTRPIRIEPGSKQTVRFDGIDLRARQSRLYAVDRWPWDLEVRVEALRPDLAAPPLAETVARVPMTPGD